MGVEAPVLNIEEVMARLPHRYPMLLVDRVIEVRRNPPEAPNAVGSKIVGLKAVTINEHFFAGHFPGLPVMPGVLIIEALAQTSALLAFRPHPSGGQWNFFIMGIDQARFRKTVVPGDVLELHCEVIKDRRSIYLFKTEAKVKGEVVAEAEILAKMF